MYECDYQIIIIRIYKNWTDPIDLGHHPFENLKACFLTYS